MPTLLVMPTYNEADNLSALVELIMRTDPAVHVLVVDDASPDGTGDVADVIAAEQPRFHVIHRLGKRGYSPASKEGLRWALANGFDIIGTMDADRSHDPEHIPALLEALDEGADLAIGSRYVSGGRLAVEWSWFRRLVSRAGSAYARWALGIPVRDCTSGYRMYRSTALSSIGFDDIRSEGYSFLIEILAALSERGAVISEVPITYVDRRAGASKISKSIIVEALLRTTGIGLGRMMGPRPHFPTNKTSDGLDCGADR